MLKGDFTGMKTLAFMQTHIITKGIINEYKKLENSGNADCILFINNLSNKFKQSDEVLQEQEFYGEKVKCFFLNKKIWTEMKLPFYTNKSKHDENSVLWYNADYPFYIVQRYFPDYDYYWRLEYDDFFNDNTWKSFFEQYENDSTDLIIPGFEEVNPNSWSWQEHSGWIYKDIKKYRSFFAVSRLSKRACIKLYEARLEHKKKFESVNLKNSSRWVFCECFVPTEVMRNKFSAKSLDGAVLSVKEIDLNEDRIWQYPDKKLYHPVKGNYAERVEKLENEVKKLKTPMFYFGRTEDYRYLLIILFKIKMKFRLKEKNK